MAERRWAPDPETLRLLRDAPFELVGRMPWSSNATFLVAFDDEPGTRAVYKPLRGERPLWDFPPGLHRREVAAFELSAVLGWGVVPPTVLRDGPHGEGSVQLFVDADFSEHYFTILDGGRHRADLEAICVFDLVANNTDRKGGHCLLGADDRVYAIDNGLSFHEETKIRTVLWDFAGEPIPASLLADLERLTADEPPEALVCLLDPAEVDAVIDRAHRVLRSGTFPVDRTGHAYPWPLV